MLFVGLFVGRWLREGGLYPTNIFVVFKLKATAGPKPRSRSGLIQASFIGKGSYRPEFSQEKQ